MKSKQSEMELGVRFSPPTLAQVHAEVIRLGMPWTEAEKFHSYHSAGGWMIGRNKMKSWKDALNYWRLNGIQGQSKEDASKKRTVYELTKIIEANQKLADSIKRINSSEVATGRKWKSELARAKYKEHIEHIRELNAQLASM